MLPFYVRTSQSPEALTGAIREAVRQDRILAAGVAREPKRRS